MNNCYRNGRVHIMREMCKTCIFRADTPVDPKSVKRVVDAAVKNGTTVVCHDTLGTKANAGCRGFFTHKKTAVLSLAERMGVIEFVETA